MPTNYGYRYETDEEGRTSYRPTTTISCGTPGCGHRVELRAARYATLNGHELDVDGNPVSETFRFIPGRGRYTTMCREHERLASQRSRAASGGRRAARAITGKFGVELELRFPRDVDEDDVAEALHEAGLAVGSTTRGEWNVRGDGSIAGHGYEVCSPPLQGEDGFEQLRRACRALLAIGGKPDRSCGLHVHHDLEGVPVAAIKRFVRTWANSQHLIDGLVAPSRRDDATSYCTRLTSDDLYRIESSPDLMHVSYVSRYKTVNIASYPRHGTVEVRQHQGTCDYEKIRTWVLMGQAMLKDACLVEEPRPAATCVKDLLDRLGGLIDATAKTFCLGRALEFGHAVVTTASPAAAL